MHVYIFIKILTSYLGDIAFQQTYTIDASTWQLSLLKSPTFLNHLVPMYRTFFFTPKKVPVAPQVVGLVQNFVWEVFPSEVTLWAISAEIRLYDRFHHLTRSEPLKKYCYPKLFRDTVH